MALNKKQKMYGAILGITLSGFALDQLVAGGTGPEPAEAQVTLSTPATASTVQASLDTGHRALTGTLAGGTAMGRRDIDADQVQGDLALIADRLDQVAQVQHVVLSNVVDAFEPDPAWLPAQTQAQLQPTNRNLAVEFAQQHQLTMVILTRRGGLATINGKTLKLGQAIDNFTLTSVTSNKVTLKHGPVAVQLILRQNNLSL